MTLPFTAPYVEKRSGFDEELRSLHRLLCTTQMTLPSQNNRCAPSLLRLNNLIDPHIMTSQLRTNTAALTRRSSEHLSPLEVARSQPRYIRKVGRQCSRTVSSNETHDHTIAELASPVRVQFAVCRSRLAIGTEVCCCFTEFVLVDSEESLSRKNSQQSAGTRLELKREKRKKIGDLPYSSKSPTK